MKIKSLVALLTVMLIIIVIVFFAKTENKKLDFSGCVGCSVNNCSEKCKVFLPRSDAKIAAFGNISGYYNEVIINPTESEEGDDIGSEPIRCSRLVVKYGSQDIVEPLLVLYRTGSRINEINKDGNLVVNISLGGLNDSDIKKILS